MKTKIKNVFKNSIFRKNSRLSKTYVTILSLSFSIICTIVFTLTFILALDSLIYDFPDEYFKSVSATLAELITIFLIFQSAILSAVQIASEKEKQTFDLILTTKLSSFDIAIGSFLSVSLQITVIFLSIMPLLAVGTLSSDINPFRFVIFVLNSLLTFYLFSAVGTFFSALANKNVLAILPSIAAIVISNLFNLIVYAALFSTDFYRGYEGMPGFFAMLIPFATPYYELTAENYSFIWPLLFIPIKLCAIYGLIKLATKLVNPLKNNNQRKEAYKILERKLEERM